MCSAIATALLQASTDKMEASKVKTNGFMEIKKDAMTKTVELLLEEGG